jgi:hypothetical protein
LVRVGYGVFFNIVSLGRNYELQAILVFLGTCAAKCGDGRPCAPCPASGKAARDIAFRRLRARDVLSLSATAILSGLRIRSGTMMFHRPFRAEIVGDNEIRIVDADGAVVTWFPRLTESLQADFARAEAIAGSDMGEGFDLDLELNRDEPTDGVPRSAKGS